MRSNDARRTWGTFLFVCSTTMVIFYTMQRYLGRMNNYHYNHISNESLAIGVLVLTVLAATTFLLRYSTSGGATIGLLLSLPFIIMYGFWGLLLPGTLVVLTGLATRFHKIKDIDLCEADKKPRDSSQAIANVGPSTLLMTLAVVFDSQLLAVASAASVASSTADTLSSEIGQAIGKGTFDIHTLKPCLPGVDGGVSLAGSFSGIFGAFAVGLTQSVVDSSQFDWILTPRIIAVVGVSGTIGFIIDSLIGATIERKGIVDNNQTNMMSSWLAGLIAVLLWIM